MELLFLSSGRNDAIGRIGQVRPNYHYYISERPILSNGMQAGIMGQDVAIILKSQGKLVRGVARDRWLPSASAHQPPVKGG
jgi:hypothetical protein